MNTVCVGNSHNACAPGRIPAVSDGNNGDSLLMLFTDGPGLAEPLVMRRSGEDYYYHADALGSVVALTDSGGNVVETYQYAAFGRPTIKDAGGSVLSQSAVGNPFMFTGTEHDAETGFYHMGHRYLDPDTGRWTQEDPIGFEGGDLNLYAYALNDPISNSDPTGTITIPGYGWIDVGESSGERSAEWYAEQYNQAHGLEAAAYYTGGLFASLWTPCTSDITALTLATGWSVARWANGTKPWLGRAEMDLPHHGMGRHFEVQIRGVGTMIIPGKNRIVFFKKWK